MRIVKLHQSHKRNRAGDICGFPDEEAEELVEAGAAMFVDEEDADDDADDGESNDQGGQVEGESSAQGDESDDKALDDADEDQPDGDLEELEYGELKSLAYAKAAEEGKDLPEVVDDQQTETLIAYLQE